MSSPTIATIEDLEIIVQLVNEFYTEEGYQINPEEIIKNLITLLNDRTLGVIYIIIDNKQTVGYCMVINSFCMELGGKIGYIDELYVNKRYRNKKLSTNCLEHIIEHYRLNGYATLRLEVEEENPQAEELYQRFGFQTHQRKLMSYRL